MEKENTTALNWKNEIIKYNLNSMCSRVCSFPLNMPYYFIKTYSNIGDIVLDPWSGKGTAPLAALLLNRNAIGNDLSPEAYVLTRAKLRPVLLSSIKEFLLYLNKKMRDTKAVIEDEDKDASIFFSDYTFKQILILKKILFSEKSDTANFIKGVILGLLHGSSNLSLSLKSSHSYSMSPNYVKKYSIDHNLVKPDRDVLMCVYEKSKLLLQSGLPNLKGKAFNSDSRNLPIPDNSVDLIFTSPPYLNVQTYARSNWLRLWFLGKDYKHVKSQLMESGSEKKYYKFMEESLLELRRVMRKNKSLFLVVGNVKSYKSNSTKEINLAEVLIPIIQRSGFKIIGVYSDSIPKNKKVFTYLKPDNGVKTESIVHAVAE